MIIIPARFGSTRFPAKMLAAETGRPLIQHVVDKAKQARLARDVLVATDDERIVAALAPFGTRAIMTSPAHPSGTDRIAEVAAGLSDDLIVNVQGDEPEISPATIDALIERMQAGDAPMGTVVTPLSTSIDPNDPNVVKAVLTEDGRAVYFSRSPVPFRRMPLPEHAPPTYHHLGIYAYRRDFLIQFAAWAPSILEQTEKLEQLRAIEREVRIDAIIVPDASPGIDTAEQYADFVRRHQP